MSFWIEIFVMSKMIYLLAHNEIISYPNMKSLLFYCYTQKYKSLTFEILLWNAYTKRLSLEGKCNKRCGRINILNCQND